MKQTLKTMLALVAGALTLSACSEEALEELNVGETISKKSNVTFTATMADDEGTRASIGTSNTIVWNEGDAISVISGGDNNQFTLGSGEGTTQGSFIGACDTGTDIYAIYPYNENNSTAYKSVNISDFIIDWNGANQTAVLGSFPLNTPMVAHANAEEGATTIPLSFQNVCGLVKFTTDYACKKVVFKAKGTDDKLVSEKLFVDYDDNNKPRIYQESGKSNTVTLTGKDGANLVAGTYYIAVMPGTLANGFELTFTNIYDEMSMTKSTTKSVTFKRGTILNLGEISIKSEMIRLSGSGTEADPYLIRDFGNLEEMRDFVNYSTGGADYYKVVNDIDGEGNSFEPIGTQANPFFGYFDGNGKTISNIKLDKIKERNIVDASFSDYFAQVVRITGLFGVIKNATIKDLTIDKMTTCSYSYDDIAHNNYTIIRSPLVGVVLGLKDQTSYIHDITINGNQNITMNDLKYTGSTNWLIYGGIVGTSFGNVTIENCTSYNNVDFECYGEPKIGGIVGLIMGGQEDDGDLEFDATVRIQMCRNFGRIKIGNGNATTIYAGGIVADVIDDKFDDDVKVQIASCVNFGEIYTPTFVNSYVAGIVGRMDSDGFGSENPVIFCCINNGKIQTYHKASGICGATYDTDTKIDCCANTGTISAMGEDTQYSIVGKVLDDEYCGTVSRCWNNYKNCCALSLGESSTITDSNNNGGTVDECISLMNERLAIYIAEPSMYFVRSWKKYSDDETKIDLDF